jgi:hypothetical protein
METITQEELDIIEETIKTGSLQDLNNIRNNLLNRFEEIDERIKLSEQRFGRMYIRSIKVPARMLLLGKPRATGNSWICIYGEIVTRKSDEFHATETKTGHTAAGLDEPGTWRIAVTKTECKWTTVHKMPKWVPIGKELDYISGNLKELVKA